MSATDETKLHEKLSRIEALLETGKGRPVPDDVKVYVGE
jgi:hypothetical protein